MTACQVCRWEATTPLINFGPQPICNRFLKRQDENEFTHSLSVSVCRECGVTQLDNPIPADEMRPRYEWITYNEPERHLDAVADEITKLQGVTTDSVIAGISYKDGSTLRRLNERGYSNTWEADLELDLGINQPGAGIETIQDRLDAESINRMRSRHPQPNVVIVRHVLEHSHDIVRLSNALKSLVVSGGYIVFEMPDQQRAFDHRDYSTMWEEHTFYFTPPTLKSALARLGFELVFFGSYPYTLEDSLVAIVQVSNGSVGSGSVSQDAIHQEIARAEAFGRDFYAMREDYRSHFRRERQKGRISILGAGHLSCALLNLMSIAEFVDFVADDDTKKQGLFMPGSRLPILPSEQLIAREIKLCCLSVRPEIEDEVIDKNRDLLERGSRVKSIFPDSPYALSFLRKGAKGAYEAA